MNPLLKRLLTVTDEMIGTFSLVGRERCEEITLTEAAILTARITSVRTALCKLSDECNHIADRIKYGVSDYMIEAIAEEKHPF